MTVRVTREAEPQFELYGAFEGEVLGGPVNTIASLTFTATGDYLIVVPKNQDQMSEPQVELGSTCSSHIPTSTSTVTRAADVMTIPAANLPWPTPEVIGPELVTNGTFDSDVSGWTAGIDAVVTWSSGSMQVQRVTGTNDVGYQVLTCDVGSAYEVSVDVTNAGTGAQGRFGISTSSEGGFSGSLVEVQSGLGVGSYTQVFVATSTTVVIGCGGVGTTAYDNISVREINPLAVSIQMSGTVTYADNDQVTEVSFYDWSADGNNNLGAFIRTSTATSQLRFSQAEGGVFDNVNVAPPTYPPGVNVPFNIASRHGSTFINGAVDGTALTANTTPTALPDLSATDFDIGPNFMGTVKLLRLWKADITDEGIGGATT